MITIRSAQYRVFENDVLRRFIDRLSDILKADFPGRFLGRPQHETRQFAERAVAFGAQHGLHTEGAVIVLAGLMVQFGDHFERSPDQAWALAQLAKPGLPGPVKMDLLLERMAARAQGRTVTLVE